MNRTFNWYRNSRGQFVAGPVHYNSIRVVRDRFGRFVRRPIKQDHRVIVSF